MSFMKIFLITFYDMLLNPHDIYAQGKDNDCTE